MKTLDNLYLEIQRLNDVQMQVYREELGASQEEVKQLMRSDLKDVKTEIENFRHESSRSSQKKDQDDQLRLNQLREVVMLQITK